MRAQINLTPVRRQGPNDYLANQSKNAFARGSTNDNYESSQGAVERVEPSSHPLNDFSRVPVATSNGRLQSDGEVNQAEDELEEVADREADLGILGQDGSTPAEGDAGDVALIDFELAEHERWAGSFGNMGTAGSDERVQFLLDQAGRGAGSGAIGGAGTGFVMGTISAGVGQIAGRRLATLAVSRGFSATPVPGLGSAIGGVMAVAGLAMRDWGATTETIGRMGSGEGYEGLANDLEGVADILDVATQLMDVLAGVLGGIAVGMWVGAVLSAGALAPLAASLSAIALGINLATTAVGVIISVVIRPTISALRALHTLEDQGDPSKIEADGLQLQAAAGQVTGAAAGAALGRAGGAIGRRGGTNVDRGLTRLQTFTTGGVPARTATAHGPRIHVEVPESPLRADLEVHQSSFARSQAADSGGQVFRPASVVDRSAASPRQGGSPRSLSAEVAAEFAASQQLASGAPLGEPELGSLLGAPGRHLRPGERDPGNFIVSRDARSRVGKQARTAAINELREAFESGIDTPRTAAAREELTSDQLLALTDHEFRTADPDAARSADQSVEASHVPAVATEPHDSHLATNVEVIPTEAHREGIHNGDTTRSLETAFPNPDYEGRPGFHEMPDRAPPTTRTDRGVLRGAEQSAAHLERNFPNAKQSEIDAARLWLAQRRAELQASGASDFPAAPVGASSPFGPSPSATVSRSQYQSHTQTLRTSDRSAAITQYHSQVRADSGRESAVWRGEDGSYFVMQGDSSSVTPPATSGRLELVYHSHPTIASVNERGIQSQPSQAGGDFGVLQFQHAEGIAGQRQSSELHFPVYDQAGKHSGYGATRFTYDPTHPLPLQVQTTLPGGRPTSQRYVGFSDFEQRSQVGPGGSTTNEAAANFAYAETQLEDDVAAARQRIEGIADATQTAPVGVVGMREGRMLERSMIQNEPDADSDSVSPHLRPSYTVSVGRLQPGMSIEIPINPAYPEPPGTTAELDLLRERIAVTKESQVDLAKTVHAMGQQAEQQQTHASQIGEARTVTQKLAERRSDHQTEATSKENTNSDQQSSAREAISNLGHSAQQVTALATLVASLRVFQGLSHLFSYLPGDLGQKATDARNDAGQLISSITRVSDTEEVQSKVEQGHAGMEANAERINRVSTEGQETDTEITKGSAQVTAIEQENAVRLAETRDVQDQATIELADAAESENEAQSAHDNLQIQLQAWANAHQQARQDAIQDALQQYSNLGYHVNEE